MRKIIFIKLYGNRNQAMLHIYISSENFISQLIKNTYMSRLRPSNHSSNIHTNFFQRELHASMAINRLADIVFSLSLQKYELIKTEDIPNLRNSQFDPNMVTDIACNILSFLKSNATKEGHTYWLYKGLLFKSVNYYKLMQLLSLSR